MMSLNTKRRVIITVTLLFLTSLLVIAWFESVH